MRVSLASEFMSLMRNRDIWAPCLQTIEPPDETMLLDVMNQYLLRTGASSHCSDLSSRPPSPFSDSDLKDEEATCCNDIGLEENYDIAQLPVTGHDFHYPDPNSSKYMVLDTRFDINADQNKKVPYPRDNDQQKTWTDEQRFYASQAQIPLDRSDFAHQV